MSLLSRVLNTALGEGYLSLHSFIESDWRLFTSVLNITSLQICLLYLRIELKSFENYRPGFPSSGRFIDMEDIYLLILGITFCLTTITYLALSQKQRDVLFRRLRLRERRASSATTPPRSLSPDKKSAINIPSPTEYIESFPGSRREALARVLETMAQANKGNFVAPASEKSMTSRMMMPYEASYLEVDGSKHTPTGFSVDEIKALGDFPDYAELSGVPLPEPYHDFDVSKALPRPYRPFRWAYHQTMCMLVAVTSFALLTPASTPQT